MKLPLRLTAVALLLSASQGSQAQSDWRLFEETTISGTISGVVQMGYVFRTTSGNLYEVAEPIVEVVVEVMPRATVLTNGEMYGLIVEGFDDPILCRKLNETSRGRGAATASGDTPAVIESRLAGAFEGFDGDTILRLANGQIWEQSEYYYHYHYAYAAEVIIYRSDSGGYRARVEGVDRAVGVRRLR